MRERVALHDGTLETGRSGTGGFKVVAHLPLAPGESGEPGERFEGEEPL